VYSLLLFTQFVFTALLPSVRAVYAAYSSEPHSAEEDKALFDYVAPFEAYYFFSSATETEYETRLSDKKDWIERMIAMGPTRVPVWQLFYLDIDRAAVRAQLLTAVPIESVITRLEHNAFEKALTEADYRAALVPIFKRHKIPLPLIWKDEE